MHGKGYEYCQDYWTLIYPFEIKPPPQPAITCSKLTIETLEQGVKYVQS